MKSGTIRFVFLILSYTSFHGGFKLLFVYEAVLKSYISDDNLKIKTVKSKSESDEPDLQFPPEPDLQSSCSAVVLYLIFSHCYHWHHWQYSHDHLNCQVLPKHMINCVF